MVEDDPQVLDLVTRVLLSQGYRVRTAANADVAQGIVRSHPGETDLLLTDVVLPGTDGRRLAVALAQLQPTLATLFMSGYSDEVIARHRVLDPGLALLAKPFTPETLLHRVRDVLDARIVTPRA